MNTTDERPLMVRDDLTVSFTPQAEEMRQECLSQSALIGKVTDEKENEIAVQAQGSLDGLIRLAEKARKAIKAPVIELGRRIDSQHEQFAGVLQEERTRITRLISDFAALELAKARAAEAAARLEAERIEMRRLSELQAIEQAEMAEERRLAAAEADLARRRKNAADEATRADTDRLEAELQRQRDIARAKTMEDIEATQERFNADSAKIAALPIPAPARAEGQTVREDWEIEVTNPWELSKFHPQCVTITPKLGEIKTLLNQGIAVRGVNAKKIVKSGTRMAGQKVIEV